jgi:hypothetical protein
MARFIGMLVLGLALVGMGRVLTRMSPSHAEASVAVVRSLQDETLSPEGLGDLSIGLTRLADAMERFGPGAPSLLLGDDFAVELQFARGDLCLMFCARTEGVAHRRALREGPRGISIAIHSGADVLREQYPEIADLPLTSISVRRPWFTGRTSSGIRLGDSFTAVLDRHPRPDRGWSPDPYLAGTATPEPLATPHLTPGMMYFPDADMGVRRDDAPFEIRTRYEAGGAEVEMIVAHRLGR